MNIYHKIFFVVIVASLLSVFSWSSERENSVSDDRKKQCEDAKHGRLDLNNIQNIDSFHNSYLFNCAISIVVPSPAENIGSIKIRVEKS